MRQRNSSSWVPVRWKTAMAAPVRQMSSQSPALATWHSWLPSQLPFSVCMPCLRRSVSSAAYVNVVGCVNESGCNVRSISNGVRPALWLKL